MLQLTGRGWKNFFRSRKVFFEVSQVGGSQGGLARILLLGCTAGLIKPLKSDISYPKISYLFLRISQKRPSFKQNSNFAVFFPNFIFVSWVLASVSHRILPENLAPRTNKI